MGEFPLVYLTLDDRGFAIDYGGISGSRLEVLEERLRDDIISELNAFGGRYYPDYSA